MWAVRKKVAFVVRPEVEGKALPVWCREVGCRQRVGFRAPCFRASAEVAHGKRTEAPVRDAEPAGLLLLQFRFLGDSHGHCGTQLSG